MLCVDETSGIQALERALSILRLGLGYFEAVPHDHRRRSTTKVLAALDTANGKALTQCRQRHRRQECLGLL